MRIETAPSSTKTTATRAALSLFSLLSFTFLSHSFSFSPVNKSSGKATTSMKLAGNNNNNFLYNRKKWRKKEIGSIGKQRI